MRTSILICATCLVVSGCSAQLRFPSLSSALSSLTGFGSGASSAGSGGQSGSSSSSSSPYSGLVRDYGRNLMMAMSSIYPSIFKPPQAQQASAPQQQQPQSPFEQFAASQPLQSLFSAATGSGQAGSGSGSAGPSFSFGGSTFSISPSLPFGALSGAASGPAPQQAQQAGPGQQAHSPFSASFGSSINSPPSFGPLSSAPFFQSQSMPSFAPASSYSAAFEAANGGPAAFGQAPASGQPSGLGSFQSLGGGFGAQPFDSAPGSLLSSAVQQQQQQQQGFGSAPHSASQFMGGLGAPPPPQQQPQSGPGGPLSQQAPQAAASAPQPTQVGQPQQQYGHHQHHSAQQYRPDMMSIAASAPVPSSNSYANYGSIPAGPSQQAPASYQQPSYR